MITSFLPIEPKTAKILILGSIPGIESLKQQQYYAHPRNAFWYIMGKLYGALPELSYSQRKYILELNHIAVWDTLKHCERKGSLDSNIIQDTEITNLLEEFIQKHQKIHAIGFNGKKSHQTFIKHVWKKNPSFWDQIKLVPLPSTSPAHAVLSKEEKALLWSEQLNVPIL
ncbi:MAG: TDG/mug DNA glycosylase family protein [bacterium]|jgi:TDG/mug DNA glycosylase family protein